MNNRYVPMVRGKELNQMFQPGEWKELREYVESNIFPVTLCNPVYTFVGYKKEEITEGYIVKDLFFANIPFMTIFSIYFTNDYEKINHRAEGVFLVDEIGDYVMLESTSIRLQLRKPSKNEETWYFILPYNEKRGINKCKGVT